MKRILIVYKWLVRLAAAVVRRRRRPDDAGERDRFVRLLRRDFLRGWESATRGSGLTIAAVQFTRDGAVPVFTWLAFAPRAKTTPREWPGRFFAADELPAGWVWLVEPPRPPEPLGNSERRRRL